MRRPLALSLPVFALLVNIAWAEDHDPHAGHGTTTASTGESEATKAFEAANAKMHAGMAAALTGDPDVDFAQSMIAHHQGAIDMAEVVLKYGKDPETRKLAEEIVKAQTVEIAFLKEWLAKRGK
jgi:uncharacterized protein (DUF305 family)